jgi:hypothetical protein
MVYGIVMAALLLFPWTLVGVVIVGVAVSAVRRNLAHHQAAGWITRCTREAACAEWASEIVVTRLHAPRG